MIILEILLFVALIAVIFGVSMHDAFWGIVAFAGGSILASIVALFVKSGFIRISKKINYLKSADGKKATKNKISNGIAELLVALWLILPFAIEIVAHTAFKEFADKNELPIFIIALSAFVIPLVTIAIIYRSKKRTR